MLRLIYLKVATVVFFLILVSSVIGAVWWLLRALAGAVE